MSDEILPLYVNRFVPVCGSQAQQLHSEPLDSLVTIISIKSVIILC